MLYIILFYKFLLCLNSFPVVVVVSYLFRVQNNTVKVINFLNHPVILSEVTLTLIH